MNQLTEYFAEVDWGTLITVWGMRVVSAVVILLLGLWLASMIARLASGALTRAHCDSMLVSFLRRILYSAALVIVFVTVLAQLGVQTTSLPPRYWRSSVPPAWPSAWPCRVRCRTLPPASC